MVEGDESMHNTIEEILLTWFDKVISWISHSFQSIRMDLRCRFIHRRLPTVTFSPIIPF